MRLETLTYCTRLSLHSEYFTTWWLRLQVVFPTYNMNGHDGIWERRAGRKSEKSHSTDIKESLTRVKIQNNESRN